MEEGRVTITKREYEAMRAELQAMRAQLQAVLTERETLRETIARLEARVRLEVAWQAAILAGRAQTPSNHGGLLTGR